MSILLIFNNKDPKPWKSQLQDKIRNTEIEIYPNIQDKSKVDFIICWKPTDRVFDEFPNLKVVQSVGASIDHIINSQKINEHIIISRIVDKKLSVDMWEYLLSVVLSEMKNLNFYYKNKANKIWKQKEYKSINDTTISILGLGKIGSYVAEKFAEIGFEVKGWSNSQKEITNVKSYIGKDEFYKCLENSDFLINILPLTKETTEIINKKSLKKIKKGGFFINVGRGEHLNEANLIELLNKKHLSGALLDVFREEPLKDKNILWKQSNLYITPHIASLTNVKSVINQIAENHHRFIANKKLLNVVSLKKGY